MLYGILFYFPCCKLHKNKKLFHIIFNVFVFVDDKKFISNDNKINNKILHISAVIHLFKIDQPSRPRCWQRQMRTFPPRRYLCFTEPWFTSLLPRPRIQRPSPLRRRAKDVVQESTLPLRIDISTPWPSTRLC